MNSSMLTNITVRLTRCVLFEQNNFHFLKSRYLVFLVDCIRHRFRLEMMIKRIDWIWTLALLVFDFLWLLKHVCIAIEAWIFIRNLFFRNWSWKLRRVLKRQKTPATVCKSSPTLIWTNFIELSTFNFKSTLSHKWLYIYLQETNFQF